MIKKILPSLIILALIIAGWYSLQNKPAAPIDNQTASVPVAKPSRKPVPITQVDKSKLPDRFPADVPLEAGATITQNYNAVNAAGMFQSSREFVSKKFLDANFTLYQAALKKTGWTITSAINDPGQSRRIIFATKGNNSLNILIQSVGDEVKVSINNETKP